MTTKKPKTRNYHLAIPFEQEAAAADSAEPVAAHQPGFLAHLRTFYLIDELGRTHRL